MERHEFWTVSWNNGSKRLGMELYWTEGDENRVDIQMGSQDWNHDMEHPVVKML